MATHQAWRDTPQWRATRKAALERDGHRCTRCGRGRGDGARLHVDHIVRVNDGGEAFDLTNTQTLCASCHGKKSGAETAADNRGRARARRNDAQASFEAETVTPAPLSEIFREPPGGTLNGSEASGSPRFLSDPHPDRAGSRGEEWGRWMEATFGQRPRPWQQRVADRMLEVDAVGHWCWSAFVISVPRQQGKSWTLRGVLAWLASQGLLVLATVNRLRTAGEIIRPLGRWAIDNGGTYHRAIDQPAVEWPSGGGRVVFQAATDALAVGWSPDAGAVDEAWDVPEIPVVQGLVPAMSDRDNPLLMFTSTVGLTTSDLLNRYRSYALSGERMVGIAEWSAPPGADWLDEEVWRQATPEWSPKRLRFLREQSKMLSESAFRSQMLNQTVHADDSWVAPSLWSAAVGATQDARTGGSFGGLEGRQTGGTVAVEITLDGSLHYVVHAVRDGDGVTNVALHSFRTFREVDTFIARAARPTTVLAPGIYRDRLSRVDKIVGSSDVSSAMPVFMSTLTDGRLRHPGDERLTEQMLMARAHVTKAGQQTLVSADGRPLSAVRAMLWAASNEAEQRDSRPKLRVAR